MQNQNAESSQLPLSLNVPLTPNNFFAKITFHNCPVYYGEKVYGPGFFPQMLYPFKTRKLGNFLANGRSHRRMGLVYFVTSSQCFIHARNKHKLREIAFFFYRMPDSSIVFGFNNKSVSESCRALHRIRFLTIIAWSV